MEQFTIHTGLVAPLDRENVDTDAIIPKQFLKSIKRTGFGPNLFDEWRYKDVGEPGQDNSKRPLNPDFVLNQPRYQGASVLLARKNFGCGSSREHAPWALQQYGFRAIIAPSFADIFFNNCFKNGLLPIVLTESQVDHLFNETQAFNRLPAHCGSGQAGCRHAGRHGLSVRCHGLPQVLLAQRFRRHRPDPALRRSDQGLRSTTPGQDAVARAQAGRLMPANA